LNLAIAIEQGEDRRWIAEVIDLPGTLAYGHTRKEAVKRFQALALRVLAARLDNGEDDVQLDPKLHRSIRPLNLDNH